MIGKRISEERQRLGLSQKDVAEMWAIGRSMVATIETGRSPLDVERLLELGKAGFDIHYVLYGERSPVAASRLLDWKLMAKIVDEVHKWSQAHEIRLPPEKEVLILKLLYEHFASSGIVDDEAINQILQLAA